MAAHQPPLSLRFSRQEHEWVAISFSNAWKGKVKMKSLSRVRLLVTPWTAAYQAPPSMGFSRPELSHLGRLYIYIYIYIYTHTHTYTAAAKSLQSCLTLCDPVEGSPWGSPVPGILQARSLEWVAMPSFRGSSWPRDLNCVSKVSCIGRQALYH